MTRAVAAQGIWQRGAVSRRPGWLPSMGVFR